MFQRRRRYGEQGVVPFRTTRFYCIKNQWWFAVRRGPDQGPYPSKAEARQSLIGYLNNQFGCQQP